MPRTTRPHFRISPAAWGAIGLAITAAATVIVALINQPPAPTTVAAPALTSTGSPTPTSLPIPTATPIVAVSPTPSPLARITYPALSQVPILTTRYIELQGDYRPDLADSIWLFVVDPAGRYYPESLDPCNGRSAPEANGRWEMFLGVGSDGDRGLFHIVLTTASASASSLIASDLMQGCRTGVFPSYAQLPPEVTEQGRVAVTRLPASGADDLYPSMPPLRDAGLEGVVSVSAFGSEGDVLGEEWIDGTTSSGSGTVWALVYTFYGRWYPQSINPCSGNHSQRTGDHWRTKAIFGGSQDAGKPFYLAVVLADNQASALFDQAQRESCAQDHYAGFLTIDLPDGISLKYSSRVIRR